MLPTKAPASRRPKFPPAGRPWRAAPPGPGHPAGRRRRVLGALLAAAAATASATLLLGASGSRPVELAVVGAPDGERVELLAGQARLADVAGALARHGRPGVLRRQGGSWLLGSTLVVRPGARLTVHAEELRLRSEPGTFVGLEARGGALDLSGGAVVTSWDPAAGEADREPGDGRAWVLARDRARLRVAGARLRMLGYDDPERTGLAWRSAAGGEVAGATVTGNWDGVSALGAEPLAVRGAVIERSGRDGVSGQACQAAGGGPGLLVERTVVRDNGGNGVVLGAGCGGAVVRASRAERNAGGGVVVRPGAAGVLIEGSEADGNVGPGIDVAASAGTRVVRNLAYGNLHGVAVHERASGTVLERNRLTANRGDGLRVTGGAALAAVRDNLMDANHRAGAFIDAATAALGSGNELTGNDVGVWATAVARRIQVAGNRVAGNSLDDLRLGRPAAGARGRGWPRA